MINTCGQMATTKAFEVGGEQRIDLSALIDDNIATQVVKPAPEN